MLADPDWRRRYAALMALSAIGEGCHKQMEEMLGQIVNGVPGVMQVRKIIMFSIYSTSCFDKTWAIKKFQ